MLERQGRCIVSGEKCAMKSLRNGEKFRLFENQCFTLENSQSLGIGLFAASGHPILGLLLLVSKSKIESEQIELGSQPCPRESFSRPGTQRFRCPSCGSPRWGCQAPTAGCIWTTFTSLASSASIPAWVLRGSTQGESDSLSRRCLVDRQVLIAQVDLFLVSST